MKTLELIHFALRKRIDKLDAMALSTQSPVLLRKYRRIRRRLAKRWRFITGPMPPQLL